MAMQFWGVEVASKESSKVQVEMGQVIHLSQATLSDVKKASEPVMIHVTVAKKKFVLGVLSKSSPQLSFDLVFDTEFEISHNFNNGSVHFLGYQTDMSPSDDEFDSDNSSDEDLPVLQGENGKAVVEAPKPKVAAKSGKDNKPKPDDSDEDSSDEEGDSSDDLEGLPDNSDSDDDEDDDEDDSEDDDMSEDEKPAKAESAKKRPNADAKTPESKKAKLVTPQKTDGKKGGTHTATPHPSKKVGKTSGGEKSTPKSASQVSCGSCSKTFNSNIALKTHAKAKHSAK